MAVMQQRILHLLEQYQLGQEGASATNEGGMAPKVRQHPSRAFWQAAESTALWHGSQACKVIWNGDFAFHTSGGSIS